MQLALHSPKQPAFAVLDRQTCFDRLSQVTRTQQTKDGLAKIPDPPYAAQCCSSQYFTQYFELQSDRKMAYHLFLPRSLHRPPEAPGTVGGPSTLPSSPPPAFPTTTHRSRTPHHQSAWFADRHGRWPLPSAPRRSTPHAPRGSSTRPRESIECLSV